MNYQAEISSTLAAQPGWEKLSAYERTKMACEALTRAGESIPSWNTLRDIIGKGSAGDINRAKKDFRVEHADVLRKMEGFSAEGVPPSLTKHILGLWQEAVFQAQGAFSEKERAWEEDVEQAVAAYEVARADADRAQAELQAAQAKADGIEQARLALQDQVRSEQAARVQAEKMMDEIRADLLGQRDRLDAALATSKAELEKAITRLEATERRSMMEIERARQEAAQKVTHATALLKSEQDKYALETIRLSKQIQDGRAQSARMQERLAALEPENRALSDRARRAEALVAELQAQNAKLVATVSTPRLRRSAGLKTKAVRRPKDGTARREDPT